MLSLPCLYPLGTHLSPGPDYSEHLKLWASYRNAFDLYPGQVGRVTYLKPLDSLLNQQQVMDEMDKYTSFQFHGWGISGVCSILFPHVSHQDSTPVAHSGTWFDNTPFISCLIYSFPYLYFLILPPK